MARDPARHTVTVLPASTPPRERVPVPYDQLADPDNDSLIGAALTLWPQGAAWGTPDGAAMDLGSRLARFTRVMVDGFLYLYRRAFLFAREATVSGVGELLPEWEADYGLPDMCDGDDQTTAERINRLAAKVMSEKVITPSEFIRLARSYGFEVAIEETDIFSCGFSECGGEHETGAAEQEVYFIVRVRDLQVTYFLAGEGECGADPLFAYGAAEKLICIIRQVAPAWTIPVLGEWRYFGEFDELPGSLRYHGRGVHLF
jgi:uncharacterized protein YmfQ (DUF2313 family)